MKTESEILFEQFCSRNEIRCEPVATNSIEEQRSPDYDIYPNGQKVVTEVKQIDPNADEVEQQEIFDNGGIAIGGGVPGSRVRSKISAGASQIRVRAKGKYPSLLVLYNNVPLTNHTEPYFVCVAMYGLETHVLGIPKDNERPPYLIDKRFGPKRKMTDGHNTCISGVAVLFKNMNEKPQLTIFHNVHADIPLKPETFRDFGVTQFTLEEKVKAKFQGWREVC